MFVIMIGVAIEAATHGFARPSRQEVNSSWNGSGGYGSRKWSQVINGIMKGAGFPP
jgi:hypothetical protein